MPWKMNLNASPLRPLMALSVLCAPALASAGLPGSITPSASYTGEAAWLVDGGENTGGAYAGQFHLGADVDLDRAFGWQGGTLKINFSSRHGDNLAVDEIGNSTSVQEIYGGQGERLANLTLAQTFDDGRYLIEGGRTVANIHFLGSGLCQYFQLNAACGNPTFVFRTSSFTWWPVSTWGAHAQAWITPRIYAHVGAYQVDTEQANDGEHGFDWFGGHTTGAIYPFAFGYKTMADQVRLPGYVELGGWVDTSEYSDPLLDSAGTPAAHSGEPYATHDRRSGVFLRFEQQITRADTAGERGLTVFGAVLTGIDGELIEDHQIQLGFVQKGTFASRPQDTLAFVVNLQDYSSEALRDLAYQRAAAGGSGTPPGIQTMMELSYGVQVTPALRVQPNLQYIIDPDQFADPARTQDLPNAFAVGLRVDWNLTAGLEALLR